MTIVEKALATERSERVAAQKALADAQTTIHQLQTKLGHAEIAASEALAAEHQARMLVQAKLDELTRSMQPDLAEPLPGPSPKKRGRPARSKLVAEAPEPQPVKWWLPNYQAHQKRKPVRSK